MNWWILIAALVWAAIVFWLVYVTSEKWSPFDDPDDTSYSLILLIIAILLIGTFLAVII